jgi:hypothetical protein
LPLDSPHWDFICSNFEYEKGRKFVQKFIASDNKFSGLKFHQVCDGMEDTLTLIRYGKE